MKNKLNYLLVIFTFLLTTMLFAQPVDDKATGPSMKMRKEFKNGFDGKMKGGKGGPCPELIFKELGLNEKQMDQLIEIKKEEMKEGHKLRSKMQEYKHLLQMAMIEDELDEKEIYSLSEQIGKVEQDMIKQKVEQLKKLKALLTKEQFKKLNLQKLMSNPEGPRGRLEMGGRGDMGPRKGPKQE